MKSITISSPDEIFQKTVDALAYLGGYVDVEENNDDAKLVFAKEKLIVLLGDKVREYTQQQIRGIGQSQIQEQIRLANEQIAATYPTISVEIN